MCRRCTVVVSGILGIGALRQTRIKFDFDQYRAGQDDIAGLAGQRQHFAGERRGHIDHGLGGFHRHQRCVQTDHIADLDMPFDDFGVRQAFAQIRQMEGFYCAHGQLAARVRLAAATIFSTLGRYFISRRNSGMWVS